MSVNSKVATTTFVTGSAAVARRAEARMVPNRTALAVFRAYICTLSYKRRCSYFASEPYAHRTMTAEVGAVNLQRLLLPGKTNKAKRAGRLEGNKAAGRQGGIRDGQKMSYKAVVVAAAPTAHRLSRSARTGRNICTSRMVSHSQDGGLCDFYKRWIRRARRSHQSSELQAAPLRGPAV